jgi:very-short-patch-repair endonuclease
MEKLAETQYGLVAKHHLADHDLGSNHWKEARRNGRWEELSPRVLRSRGSPESDGQRCLAAVLDATPGSMLHGPSALAWLGIQGYSLSSLHIARPRNISGLRSSLAELHELRKIRSHDVLVHQGIPTETALRAIWAEAAPYASNRNPFRVEMGARKIGRLLDQAHRKGLVTWAALRESVEDLPRRGLKGAVIMRALSQARPPGSSPTESGQEDQLEKILANNGIDPLERQVAVGGHEPVGRSDFRDPELPLVVEVNSLTFHTTPSDRQADLVRYRAYNEAGFTVCVVWEGDLWAQPRVVVETVREARRKAIRCEAVTVHSPSCPWPLEARSGGNPRALTPPERRHNAR